MVSPGSQQVAAEVEQPFRTALVVRYDGGVQHRAYFDVVVSVHSQQVFGYVGLALHVHPVSGNFEAEGLRGLLHDLYFECFEDLPDVLVRDVLAQQPGYVVVAEGNGEGSLDRRIGADVGNARGDMSSGQRAHEPCR